jgi:hypothetical protein
LEESVRWLRIAAAVLALMTAAVAMAGDGRLALEQVLAGHLASIGTPEARAAVKSRIAEGTSSFKPLNAGGRIDGRATLLSEAQEARLVMKYDRPEYPGEDILTDGSRIQVYGRPRRSAVAFFLYNQASPLVTEGLLGGTLSTAWPLLRPDLRSAKLTYNGVKKINGESLHEVRYEPKKRTDVDIRLYFSKDDFRHVLTITTLTVSPRLQSGAVEIYGENRKYRDARGPDVANAQQQVIRHRLEERFSDFTTVNGLTLPTSFEMRYDVEGQRQSHDLYTNTFNDVINNVTLDPESFQFK